MRPLLTALLCLWVLTSTAQRFFLMGDAGEPKFPEDANFEQLKKAMATATKDDYLIFLGDNLYPLGLPDVGAPKRQAMERKLNVQLEVVKEFPGRAFMVPGNHDWAKGRDYGWQQLLNAERYVKKYLDGQALYVPGGGCPGPLEINVSPTVVLIFLDTQYFLHPWRKPDEGDGCEQAGTLDALIALHQTIQRHKNKHIVVIGHHPMYTYGEHNGNFPLKDHLFPLRQINDKLWIPLPVIGSLQPFYRKVFGDIQDNTHPKYRAIRKGLLEAFDEAEHVIYACGHEHALQLIQREGHHFIVSGSGSKSTHVRQGPGTLFCTPEKGFAELNIEGETARVRFWRAHKNEPTFDTPIYSKEIQTAAEQNERPDSYTGTVKVAASTQYGDPNKKHRLLGQNYRAVWQTPVEVPFFDLANEKGGLDVLKQGGGQQTKSLRLQNERKQQYVLRSVEKYPGNAIPPSLRKTLAADIVQDQISASHPYAAMVIPYLADPLGIYHTNPSYVYLPDDPLLGDLRQEFGNTLMLFEERPDEGHAPQPFFGAGDDIDGTDTVLENLNEDNDDRVDQDFVVRNRLFDMIIGDWDRHDDQWRWAQFDDRDGKGKSYRLIPRDRDQAFFVNEGWLPAIAKRKWALPKIEGFDETMDWAPGFNHNARFFDRTFMSEPDWSDWQTQIELIQSQLTDSIIDAAIRQWPDTIYVQGGKRIATILKARRDALPQYAREHYEFLSKEVEIVGTAKHEHFLIEALNDSTLRVTVRKINGDGDLEQVIYQRVFYQSETKEIRLYGRENEDQFELKGTQRHPIRVRIIGGRGDDTVIGDAGSFAKNIYLYDNKDTEVAIGLRLKDRTQEGATVHDYNRKSFEYDLLLPIISAQINRDDGLYLGAGFNYTRHAWRKTPYASRHFFVAHRSLATNSYNFKYVGSFSQVFGKWALEPAIEVLQPFFVNNFFGLGNESQFVTNTADLPVTVEDAIDFYRYRLQVVDVELGFKYPLGSRAGFTIAPTYREVAVENLNSTFLTDSLSGVNLDKVTSLHTYAGLRIGLDLDTRDNKLLPTRGMTATIAFTQYAGQNIRSEDLGQLRANWAFYVSRRIPARLIVANRVGMIHNTSDFEFFNAATLGGRSNLRGTRRTRFHGRTAFYHNLDLRLKIASFQSYVFPGQIGLLAFHDVGRVWVADEQSSSWHQGYGAGLWVAPLNRLLVNFSYAWGEDEQLPSVGLGFQF